MNKDKYAELAVACGGRINPETLRGIALDLEFQTTAVKEQYKLFMFELRQMFAKV